ncbi:MAG: hydantoinase B/oxoprolinase family protein [Acetobacteraceae bacterium]|nr:hydantoinase B/oxoprolinase family protein [Acetobacteraceae bacterium]
MAQAGRIRIGIDIGGTFTDLQVLDEASGALHSLKTPTTPDDPSVGLMTGIDEAAARFGFALADIRLLLHGTTIATNAVLERKLARGMLLTTAGFRDVLEIGRHARRDIYGLKQTREEPLIPRDRRVEVAERMRADGSIERALDPAGLEEAVRQVGPETVAVCLLNANANAAHERAVRDRLAAAFPRLPISLSSEVSPEIREFERTSTTVLNALLVPVVRSYLDRLQRRLGGRGVGARLLLVQSNGGVCSAAVAAEQPVRLLLSGPSGGALAAQLASARLRLPNLVGVDMGGTSFDVCVVRGGLVTAMTQGEIDGLPVRLPMVEIRTIGAGGGSIASVLPGERLVVGPQSAGARPGPVCYGHGGTLPTVTDANLVLGRLDETFFLGGRMALDSAGARTAVGAEVGGKLGLEVEAAAAGMLRLTNASLASAIRLSLFEKGLDPREFSLLSFGGAGGLHAIEVAEELGIARVVFPPDASTFSASGILQSDIVHDMAASRIMEAEPAAVAELARLAAGLRAQGSALLEGDGVPAERRELRLAADMRYRGQAFELVVPWGDVTPDAENLAQLIADFHAMHQQRFTYANPADPVEIVTLRLTATGRLPAVSVFRPAPEPGEGIERRRRVFIGGRWREVAVHRREALAGPVTGPALIEEAYTTAFIGEGWRCAPGPGGDLVAERVQATEERSPAALGPIELEVMRNALTAAAAEMDATIWRTSRSTIVRELLDYSTAVFTADGDIVAQSARIPQHLNSMGAGLRTIVSDYIPAAEWAEGDVIITNDPYCGGQHIPDILAFRAVFHAGTRIGIVGTLCHHLDMGGIAAGSYGATATEVFQEGLRIPPMKLVRAGVMNAEVLAMMRQNVRRPDMLWGDLQAQLASLAVGEASLRKLADRYGGAALMTACGRMLDSSEAAMRAMIGRMPDGHYGFEDFIDDDGLSDAPIRIHAAVEIRGDTMDVDLTGSGAQALGPINATLASAGSAVSYAVMACADEPIPANAGCYRPVIIRATEGSIVHARHPAPVANRIAATHRLATTLLGALHRAVPDRVPAAYYGVSYVCSFQTIGADGGRGVLVEIEVGGSGGHPAQDGLSGYSSGMHNNANIPVEMIESELPLTIVSYGLLPGTAGDGQFRGGLGLQRAWRVDCAEAVFTANLDRFKFAPYGLAGGSPGAVGRLSLVRDGKVEALGSKVGNLRLRRGDVIRLETSGGGGFGPPEARAPEARSLDRVRGYTV